MDSRSNPRYMLESAVAECRGECTKFTTQVSIKLRDTLENFLGGESATLLWRRFLGVDPPSEGQTFAYDAPPTPHIQIRQMIDVLSAASAVGERASPLNLRPGLRYARALSRSYRA